MAIYPGREEVKIDKIFDMGKIDKLKRQIKKAEDKFVEADSAVQNIMPLLKFDGFEDESDINITMCNGGEIILEYHRGEMDVKQIVAAMSERGYITKSDFVGIDDWYEI